MDHVAEDAAVPVDLLEVDLLNEIEAQFVANDLTCDQDDRRTIAIGLVYPVDEMQAAGAAAAGKRSATCASACAANAPASSCLTETHSISLFSSERAIRLSVSPTTP